MRPALMTRPGWIRQHLAALRALLVLTAVCGVLYPLLVTATAQLPGLKGRANGSLVTAGDRTVGSRIIGQAYLDGDGKALQQYFQSRPSAAGDGYDPTSTSASNLGPEDVVDTLPDPAGPDSTDSSDEGTLSLLTQVCSRSKAVGELEGVSAARPFCTPGGVGAVLAVFGTRTGGTGSGGTGAGDGHVARPDRVVSVNEACPAQPFLTSYRGVTVGCARYGEDYSAGETVPVRGGAPASPLVPADAVTASGSGLDPEISPAYARLQAGRVARTRGAPVERVRELVDRHTRGRALGFLGEPGINVLELNLELDRGFPFRG